MNLTKFLDRDGLSPANERELRQPEGAIGLSKQDIAEVLESAFEHKDAPAILLALLEDCIALDCSARGTRQVQNMARDLVAKILEQREAEGRNAAG